MTADSRFLIKISDLNYGNISKEAQHAMDQSKRARTSALPGLPAFMDRRKGGANVAK